LGMSNRVRIIVYWIMIYSMVFLLGTILFYVLAGYIRYPCLVLYYYVLSLFGLYGYASHVYFSILVVCVALCFSPLILLVRKSPDLIEIKTVNSQLLAGFLRRYFVYFLVIFFIVVLSLETSLAYVLLSPVERNINEFTTSIQSVCDSNATCTTEMITHYIDSRLGWSWNNPMSALEIDNMLFPIDYWLLGRLGFTQAHVILWQGWGSCGEHAIVTAYLLHRLGYTVRVARFNNIDHTWAEVYVNGSWYIVDPWYIGIVYEEQYQGNKYLVPINVLASLKDFSGNHRVLCGYLDGGEMDCTSEHGY